MNLRSSAGKRRGAIFLWRYRDNARNYPGWNLSADASGACSLLRRLRALAQSSHGTSRTVNVDVPTLTVLRVPNNEGGKARWWAPSRWRVAFQPDPEHRDLWKFPDDEDPAVLTLGRDRLADLIKGVEAITHGRGDYSIGGSAGDPSRPQAELWLWWYLPPNKPLERTGIKPRRRVGRQRAGRSAAGR